MYMYILLYIDIWEESNSENWKKQKEELVRKWLLIINGY